MCYTLWSQLPVENVISVAWTSVVMRVFVSRKLVSATNQEHCCWASASAPLANLEQEFTVSQVCTCLAWTRVMSSRRHNNAVRLALLLSHFTVMETEARGVSCSIIKQAVKQKGSWSQGCLVRVGWGHFKS